MKCVARKTPLHTGAVIIVLNDNSTAFDRKASSDYDEVLVGLSREAIFVTKW